MGRKPGAALGREDVLRAALDCVAAEGPQALGINRVARQLGIRPPSLYHHVESNEALARLVAIEGWRQLEVALSEGLEAGIAALAQAFRRFVAASPGLYRVMSETPLSAEPAFEPVATQLMQRFATTLAPYGLSGEALVHAVRMLRATLHGFVLLELGGQFGMPTAVDASFEWMVQRLTAMLAAEGA